MKRRIAVWAGVGFVVASCWILYTLITPPEVLNVTLRQPWVEALAVMSCPVVTLAGRYFRLGLSFWAVAVMNAATYALIEVNDANSAPHVEPQPGRLVPPKVTAK